MKKILLILVISLSSFAAFSQNYYNCQLSTKDASCSSWRYSIDLGYTNYRDAVRECRAMAYEYKQYFCKVYAIGAGEENSDYLCQFSTQDPTCQNYRYSTPSREYDYDRAERRCRAMARKRGVYFCRVY